MDPSKVERLSATYGDDSPVRRASHEEVVNKAAFAQLAAEAGLPREGPPPRDKEKVPQSPRLEPQTELERKASEPLPVMEYFNLRVAIVAAITVTLPLVNTAFHYGLLVLLNPFAPLPHPAAHGEPGAEHGAEHVEEHATEHAAEHHRRQLHGHGDTTGLDLQWTLVIVMVLIALTIAFEVGREKLQEEMRRYAMVIEHIWSELTVLGFLALVTFMLVQSNALQAVSTIAYHDEHHLVHLFEHIHFSLFFVLVGFLFGALWLLSASVATEKLWDSFEVFIQCYGGGGGFEGGESPKPGTGGAGMGHLASKPTDSVVFADGVVFEEASAGHDYGARVCERELLNAERNFVKERKKMINWVPCGRAGWELALAQQRLAFQRLRLRFIAMPVDQGKPPLPDDFELSDYLLECTTGQARTPLHPSAPASHADPNPACTSSPPPPHRQIQHALHLGHKTWLRAAVLVFCMVEATAVFGGDTAQIMLCALGWLLLFQACIVEQHYSWVVEQLTPILDPDKAAYELARLRPPSLVWRPLYIFLHESARAWGSGSSLPAAMRSGGASAITATKGDRVERQKSRASAIAGANATGGNASGNASGGNAGRYQRLVDEEGGGGGGGGGMESPRSEERKQSAKTARQLHMLSPGEFMRLPPPPRGESRHLALFAARLKKGDNESTDLHKMKQRAAGPAQLWLRWMLLYSSLHLTTIVVFCPARAVWDWRLALGALPVLLSLAFLLPSVLRPMILALSLEMMKDESAVQTVLQVAKMKKFAQAAKLLQGLQSHAKVSAKKSGRTPRKKPPEMPKSEAELLARLPDDQKKRALQLKQAFDLFDGEHAERDDGELTPTELKDLMLSCGVEIEQAQLDCLFAEVDLDGSGAVTFLEFATHMLLKDDDLSPEEVSEAIFEMIDQDDSGVLSIAELKSAFGSLRTGLEAEELDEIVARFDEDRTGRIERSEFVRMLTELFESM